MISSSISFISTMSFVWLLSAALTHVSDIKTKINGLVQRGVNDDEITDLAEFAMDRGIDV